MVEVVGQRLAIWRAQVCFQGKEMFLYYQKTGLKLENTFEGSSGPRFSVQRLMHFCGAGICGFSTTLVAEHGPYPQYSRISREGFANDGSS